MSRRLLVIEPDASGRAMMDRALGADGYAAEGVASFEEARPLLDADPHELAIVDQFAGEGSPLEDVRALRGAYPGLPIIVTGSVLSPRVMRELLRLGAADALPKPFTPAELRDAVHRALAGAGESHVEALEYAAAMATAREAVLAGRAEEARPALARAQAISPFDAEAMALQALVAELGGRDDDADRGYRAALALRQGEDEAPPDPHEGLARIAAYGGARPVAGLDPEHARAPLWVITDPAAELREPAPCGEGPCVVVLSLGLSPPGSRLAGRGGGAIALRSGAGPRAFALMAGAPRDEALAAALASLGAGPLVATETTRARLDLERIAALRDDARARGYR